MEGSLGRRAELGVKLAFDEIFDVVHVFVRVFLAGDDVVGCFLFVIVAVQGESFRVPDREVSIWTETYGFQSISLSQSIILGKCFLATYLFRRSNRMARPLGLGPLGPMEKSAPGRPGSFRTWIYMLGKALPISCAW